VAYLEVEVFEVLILRISDLEQTCQTIKESINSKVYFAKKS
jgi:hypothetical protein